MTTTKPLSLLLAIATVLALATSTLAVDIQGFDSSTACSGSGFTFSGIAQRTCTLFNPAKGSVLIRDLSSCQTGRTYGGGGCKTLKLTANGPNVICFIGGGYTGADWFNGCGRRRLQEAAGKSECTSHANPTGIHYTHSEGSWILHTPNATQLLELLRAVEDAEKAEWLKAQGAHYLRN